MAIALQGSRFNFYQPSISAQEIKDIKNGVETPAWRKHWDGFVDLVFGSNKEKAKEHLRTFLTSDKKIPVLDSFCKLQEMAAEPFKNNFEFDVPDSGRLNLTIKDSDGEILGKRELENKEVIQHIAQQNILREGMIDLQKEDHKAFECAINSLLQTVFHNYSGSKPQYFGNPSLIGAEAVNDSLHKVTYRVDGMKTAEDGGRDSLSASLNNQTGRQYDVTFFYNPVSKNMYIHQVRNAKHSSAFGSYLAEATTSNNGADAQIDV